MTATTIIREAEADGVRLVLSPTGSIKAAGNCAAVNRWLDVLREHKAEIVEVLRVGAGDTATASRWWLLDFSDHEPLTVAFSPAATHAEVLARYQGAVAATPIAATVQSSASSWTGDQEHAVVRWLARIGEKDAAIVAEVLTACRHDDAARKYFLERAAKELPDDDRRRCSQCSNLRSGVCVVARPGGLVSAIVGYRPALPGVLHRCAGYSPNASDTDHRPGRERWPGVIQKGSE